MTAAEESVRAGRIDEALADLQTQVKKAPADPRLRVFLFQLLAVKGQWERAATQLEVAGELDAGTMEMVRAYRAVLPCERLRASIFAGEKTPLVFGEPAAWMALLVEAAQLTAKGKFLEAKALRDQAFEDAPATSGSLIARREGGKGEGGKGEDESAGEERPFSWIADADGRLGPMLEGIINGRYYWIPFSRIRELTFEAPADLRDVAWTPALLTFANGGETVAFVPTRYPGSESSPDPTIVTARSTTWDERAGDTFLGLGQRIFATDGGEHALMDVRRIRLDAPAA
ncbi:MAG: impE family protein [Myxococcales bacterium]|nr:impE family protein [Myxococcales bacterium]